jgi:hypothetical protein
MRRWCPKKGVGIEVTGNECGNRVGNGEEEEGV